jgi:uncharacterized protein
MSILQRTSYLNKIQPFIGKPIIKILVGMRRVGKSELLKQVSEILLAQNSTGPCIYINKELREFDGIRDSHELNAYITQKGGGKGAAIFIDEVQEIENWEKSVTSYLAEGMDVYITGSNAHLLSSDLATLLAGRYIEFPIYTLSFKEFSELRKSSANRNEEFSLYLKFGGLPGLHAFEFMETPSFQYLDAIYQSILLKDIVKRHNIRNVTLLDNVTQYIYDNIGNLFNANNVSKFLKSQRVNNSLPTIQTLVRYICDAFLSHQVRQYDLKGKRFLEINDKYFVSDLGLRHAILGYREADIAGILENIVYLELLRRDYKVSIGKIGDKEVDFICDRRGERIYIQVTYLMSNQNIIDREFSSLENIQDNHPKVVLSMDPLHIKRETGIQHINIIDYLCQDFSLSLNN